MVDLSIEMDNSRGNQDGEMDSHEELLVIVEQAILLLLEELFLHVGILLLQFFGLVEVSLHLFHFPS